MNKYEILKNSDVDTMAIIIGLSTTDALRGIFEALGITENLIDDYYVVHTIIEAKKGLLSELPESKLPAFQNKISEIKMMIPQKEQ